MREVGSSRAGFFRCAAPASIGSATINGVPYADHAGPTDSIGPRHCADRLTGGESPANRRTVVLARFRWPAEAHPFRPCPREPRLRALHDQIALHLCERRQHPEQHLACRICQVRRAELRHEHAHAQRLELLHRLLNVHGVTPEPVDLRYDEGLARTYLGKHVPELRTLRCEHGPAYALVGEPVIDRVTGALDLQALIVRGLVLRAHSPVAEGRHAVCPLSVLERGVSMVDLLESVQGYVPDTRKRLLARCRNTDVFLQPVSTFAAPDLRFAFGRDASSRVSSTRWPRRHVTPAHRCIHVSMPGESERVARSANRQRPNIFLRLSKPAW